MAAARKRRRGRSRVRGTRDTAEDIEKREALQRGQRILAALPEEQRAVFLLFEVERMSMAEVAEAVGCPLQTAYSRLHKARERVLAMLDRAQRREHAR